MRFSFLLIFLLFLSACTTSQVVDTSSHLIPSDKELSTCTLDSDCIPLPSQCHPTRCINKDFESSFEKPTVCTEIFLLEAAYSPDDCACENTVCVNKNKVLAEIPIPSHATRCTFRGEACTDEYQPVCGWFKDAVKCIKAPCAIDASNPCDACANEDVLYWTEGECNET